MAFDTDFYSWFSTFLKDEGLQFSKSGFKGGSSLGKHDIDEEEGNWSNVNYSGGKPPRWLFQINPTSDPIKARYPAKADTVAIGGSNTAQGDKAGLAVRILPLVWSDTGYQPRPEFEANAIFVFHGALGAGSSSDSFTFNRKTGDLYRMGEPQPYIFAALIGIHEPAEYIEVEEKGETHQLLYQAMMDAISASVTVRFKNDSAHPIEVFDLTDADGLSALKDAVELVWQAAGPATSESSTGDMAVETVDPDNIDEPIDLSTISIPEDSDLLGIDPAVYRQINGALRSGKQHLMFYGPPGTGKTSLARWVASSLAQEWTLITGSADWSSQDIIGGYQPVGGGEISFVPGVLLKAFDRPLIIDELNRCDIDKVLGPLFTVLSGQESTLPYRVDVTDKDSPQYSILPRPAASAEAYQYAPSHAWRLIATINSIDKAALYQMSYALTRRFGWIFVDVPSDLNAFIAAYLAKTGITKPLTDNTPCPLGLIWSAVNEVRVIGPAPIIDVIKAMASLDPEIDFMAIPTLDQAITYIDGIGMFILPMLDGILAQEADQIAAAIIAALQLSPDGAPGKLVARLMRGASV